MSQVLQSRRSTSARALGVAIGLCFLMFALASLVKYLPVSAESKELILSAILLPMLLTTRSLSWLIDLVGPQSLSEPASMYLSGWGIWCVAAASLLLLLAVFYAVSFSVMTFAVRRPENPSGRGQ